MLAVATCCGVVADRAQTASAAPVELRLVVHDQPEVGVEKMERRRPIVNPVSTAKGVELAQIGVDLTCWARNVRLDGQPVFERYHEGKYIDRLSVAQPDLKPGEHVIWPGDHKFTVAEDGSLSSQDSELIVAGGTVKIKCYPVTIEAFRAGESEAHLPRSMRIAPVPSLTIRETANAAKHAANPAAGKPNADKELLELLPVFDKFAPLTVWLPANQVGQGYLVHPVGLTFHLGPGGIAAGAGEGWKSDALAATKERIEIPLYSYPVTGSAASEAAVPSVEVLKFEKAGSQPTTWYPRRDAYAFRVSDFGPQIEVEGNLQRLPHKVLRVEVGDPIAKTQCGLVVELDSDHATPGGVLTARVRAVDAASATLAGRRVKSGQQRIAKAEQALNNAKHEQGEAEKALKAARDAVDAQTKLLDAAGTPDEMAALKKAVATAQAKVEPAEKLLAKATATATAAAPEVDAAKAALPDLEAASKAAALVNPLATAQPLAQLQRLGSTEWQNLAIEPASEDRTVKITLPADASGYYRLRLGVPTTGNEPLTCEQWIAVSRPEQLGLGLFTQRGRNAFYRGESFWIGLGATASGQNVPVGTPLEIDLVDPAGQRIALVQQATTTAITARETFIARLDGAASLVLAPGRYRVDARLGTAAATPLTIELVDSEVRTHFTNLLVGKYNMLAEDYERVLRGTQDAEELARGIASLGYNAFQGMSYDMQRIYRADESLERLARRHPELGPWETHYTPSGRDLFMNASVRNNLRFYENLFSYHDTALPREPHILDACERYTSLEVASLRHNPAFRGVGLYDEFYESSDTDTSQQVTAVMMKSQEMAFRAKHPGLTSSEALRGLERFASRPVGQRQAADLEKFRTWPAHLDSEWRDFSFRMGAAAKQVAPDSTNFTLMRFWGGNGGNLAPNGTPTDVFTGLDIAASVMYKDGGVGDRPVFAPMQADVMRVREGLPVWTQLHNFSGPGLYGQHLVRQAIFALSQKVEGLTYFTIQSDPRNPQYVDNRDAVRDIAERICTPYGDLLMAAGRGYKKVGVYYSRSADHLSGRKIEKPPFQAEGLWVACMRAGFPADILYDDQIAAGAAAEYDVLFAPGFQFEDEAPLAVLAALKRLVDAGKLVIVERSSKLPIEGLVRIDSDLDEYDDKQGGAFPRYVDFETDMVVKQTEKTTKLVRDLLTAHKIAPAAEHNMLFGPDWLTCREGSYLVVSNFADTGFSGLHKTLFQAPDVAHLRFPRRGAVCYDMLEMRQVNVQTDDDWMTLEADLQHLPGKIYAFLPAAIDQVVLRASGKLQLGGPLDYDVAIAAAGGKPIDAGVPLEISLLDPAGKTLHQVYRAATPKYRGAYTLPVNAAAGNWTLRVRELISGAVAESTIAVTPGKLPLARLDDRAVWLHDATQVRRVLADPAEKLIVLDDQQSSAEPQANRLLAGLKKRGIAARVVRLSDVLRLPVDWTPKEPHLDGARLWRGDVVAPGLFVDAPMILLGSRQDHRLIEALLRRDVLPEVPSENFPGPGRALVGWTRQAFSNEHDTLTVLAMDDAGLAQGVDTLLDIEHATSADLPVTPVVTKTVPNEKAELIAAKTVAPSPTGLRATISGQDLPRALSVDPSSGRSLVGTFGYGDNLFCFAADGKLLWKLFLPEHNVYFAQWCDGGRRVVAATGQGPLLFVLDGADGRVIKKLSASEWPDFHYQEGPFNTETAITISAAQKQILVRGNSGVLALDFEGRKLWLHDRAKAVANYPQESEQTVAAQFNRSVVLGDMALGGDGSQIILGEYRIIGSTRVMFETLPIWQHVPKLLSAKTGEVIWENTEEPGGQTSPVGWSVSWPTGSERPWVHNATYSVRITPEGKLGPLEARPRGRLLTGGQRLDLAARSIALYDASGKASYRVEHASPFITSSDRLSADEQRLYRSAPDGSVVCFEVASGKQLWQHQLPQGATLEVFPDGLLAATNHGHLVRFDAAGKPVWQARLADLHQQPQGRYADYLRKARMRDVDATDEFYPVGQDKPGEYDSICRFGVEQLAGGEFEALDAWKSGDDQAIGVQTPGYADSKQAAALDTGRLVTQRLTRRVIPSSTYLLEFFYRVENDDARVTAASVLTSGDKETFTGSQFAGRKGEWTFGRLAIKTLTETTKLEVGFEASGGRVLIDNVRLRPIRFPSPNLLANTELHAVEPTFVDDVRVQYDRIPSRLRESLMKQNRVAAFKQGGTNSATIYTQEEAFLHNGRLDDVGAEWTYQPDGIGFSVVLTQPAYVSHVVLYLNNATPENVYSTISVLANNLQTKRPESVELVRGNQRRFVVIHFAQPIFTDSLKLLPGMHPGKHDCLTEVEVYGPLGGPDVAAKGFTDDPLATAMFMGGPSHASDKLPADLVGDYIELGRMRAESPLFTAGLTAVAGNWAYPNSSGELLSALLPEAGAKEQKLKQGPTWKFGTLTPTTTPARYAGRLLVGSADYKLHAVSDAGRRLWAFQTGGRVHSAPLPQGDDVFFGSDDGKLYKVDVDSGTLVWEFSTGDKVRSAPALADGRLYFASFDGFLYAIDAQGGQPIWKAPLAKFTRASPAAHQGKVYIGDEAGQMQAFDAASGSPIWNQPLEGYISTCPVVTPDGVLFASDSGQLALVAADGNVKWNKSLDVRLTGQPVATQSQLLVPTDTGLQVLRMADASPDDRFRPPAHPGKVVSVLTYGDRLGILSTTATSYRQDSRTYVRYEGNLTVLAPKPAPPAGNK